MRCSAAPCHWPHCVTRSLQQTRPQQIVQLLRVPTPSANSTGHDRPIDIGRWWMFSPMSRVVAVGASRDDVGGNISPTCRSRNKMLRRTAKSPKGARRQAKLLGESIALTFPHREVAIPTAKMLPQCGVNTQRLDYFRAHVLLRTEPRLSSKGSHRALPGSPG